MSKYEAEIKRRRTFAIISHPDAGKTTLTEKFLLYGGAIAQAGQVKGKKNTRAATTSGGLEIGQNVVYIKLPGIVTAVSGVEDFDIDISTNGETYAKTNVEVGYREKAITEESAVIIE